MSWDNGKWHYYNAWSRDSWFSQLLSYICNLCKSVVAKIVVYRPVSWIQKLQLTPKLPITWKDGFKTKIFKMLAKPKEIQKSKKETTSGLYNWPCIDGNQQTWTRRFCWEVSSSSSKEPQGVYFLPNGCRNSKGKSGWVNLFFCWSSRKMF